MNHAIQSLTGLVYYSPDPARLAAFYRERLGIPLASATHGTVGQHCEGMLGGVHFAVWDEQKGHRSGPVVPVFRTKSLAQTEESLLASGVRRIHKTLDLGEGKRIAGFADPDDRIFRLIEIGREAHAPANRDSRAKAPSDYLPSTIAQGLSALVFFSPSPERLAAFCNEHLGLGFTREEHGPVPEHHEGLLGNVRFAILPERLAGKAEVAPTFLVAGLDGAVATLQAKGVRFRAPIMILDEGKRLAMFDDPDGNPFHLIDLGFAA